MQVLALSKRNLESRVSDVFRPKRLSRRAVIQSGPAGVGTIRRLIGRPDGYLSRNLDRSFASFALVSQLETLCCLVGCWPARSRAAELPTMGDRVADMNQRGSGQSPVVSRMQVDDLPDVLEALTEAFGDGFDPSWFHWKHETSPWGRSEAWVARDDRGLLGVRIMLPWQFRSEAGTLRAYRPCDTVTVPRARGRGVFSRLTREAIANLEGNGVFIFNTPNEQSKPGYLKMGFVEWARVRQRLGIVRPKKSKLGDPRPPGDSTSERNSNVSRESHVG